MNSELIYLWINQERNNCLDNIGFNFSPQFDVSFDKNQKALRIEKTEKINIFYRKNLSNLTAIIGENGTGKTTLLEYITSLMTVSFRNAETGYETWQNKEDEYDKFIAVYFERNKLQTIKIINNTGSIIYKDDIEIETYSSIECQSEDYLGQFSHVYLTNSEYAENINMRSGAVNYISLANNAIRPIMLDLFKRLFNAPDGFITDTTYNALQSILSNNVASQSSQMILDLMYSNYLMTSGTYFCGKEISSISFSIVDILTLIPAVAQTTNYASQYNSRENIEKFHQQRLKERQKIALQPDTYAHLVIDLLSELVFAYDFTLEGVNLSIDEVYSQCLNCIELIPENGEREYYLAATKEIGIMETIIAEGRSFNNLLPQSDLARQDFVESTSARLWELIDNDIKIGCSFVLKYLKIHNLGMSSGERALLNFMSRIFFSSQMNRFLPNHGFSLHKNVLLLIDEIDLYLHPEWQRRIICDLFHELEVHFPSNQFQIILTSHSPIVLSDIPRENSIFLKRIDQRIVQQERNIQTFGANIHMLYKDAFFIKNGLAMGEFAQDYVNQLIDEIEIGKTSPEEIEAKIAVIGEPIIQKKLRSLLDKPNAKPKAMLATERQQVVDFLKRQKQSIEMQLAVLERGDEVD